jgi:hypothetical protein
MPVSPGQGPFFTLLQESPQDGLRLVRGIVEHATQWQRDGYATEHQTLPVISIRFPEGEKSFEGDFGMYQWARGGTGPLVAASALMALRLGLTGKSKAAVRRARCCMTCWDRPAPA